MKKFITVAALLAAGTAFSNAAVVLTTTFEGCDQADIAGVTLNNTGSVGVVSASVSSLQSNGSDINLFTSGTAGAVDDLFIPNSNVGNGSPWTAEFSYDLGESTLTLAKIEINGYLTNGSGGYQSDNLSRELNFTVTVLSGGQNVGTFSVTDFAGVSDGGATVQTATLLGSEVELTGEVTFVLNVERGTNHNGTYFAVESIRFDDGSVIPEPSAFGLLAGVGALALVAARRRRTK